MNFLAPWAFVFAALMPLIVLLYLLKLRRRTASVSTLLFWQRVLEEKRRSALFQRLRNLLSLLLHLLIFTLLLLALAKPIFGGAVRTGTSTVLIVDTRARMQAEHQGTQRFAEAKRAAVAALQQAGPLREFAVLGAGAETKVIAPLSTDGATLARAIETLAPTDAGGDLSQAMRLAHDLLASRSGTRRIVLLTASAPDPLPTLPPGTEVEVRIFGAPAENTAITRFAVRPLPADPQSVEVLLEISHFGKQGVTGNVELRRDDGLLDVRPFRAMPGEPATIYFPLVTDSTTPQARGWLTAKLDLIDSLPLDNVAYAALPQQRQTNVLLVTEGNWFLEKLLSSDRRVRFELLSPESFRVEMQQQFDVVIFDRSAPDELGLTQLGANALFIGKSPLSADAVIEQPIVTQIDDAHPALRSVNLRNVAIGRSTPLIPAKADNEWRWQTLLGSFEHALLMAGERTAERGRRIAIIGFDLIETDLPLRVAFPLLLGNLIQWLAIEPPDELIALRAGDLHQEKANVSFSGPHTLGEKLNEAFPEIAGTWQPLRNGFYRVRRGDSESWIAVNTFAPAESDLAKASQIPGVEKQRPHDQAAWLALLSALPPWRYLALAALALLLIEWRLFHRRQTE